MNIIKGILLAAIMVMVATSFVPALQDTLSTIVTPTYSVGVAGMFGVVLVVYGFMVIWGMVKSIE